MRNQRDMESFDQLLALLVAIPAGHLFPPDVHGLVTREGTGASSATAAVTRLLAEAGRKVG